MGKKLVVNENIVMCSGVCCFIKESCYRYRLNRHFDKKGNVHPDPQFTEPKFDGKRCRYFKKVEVEDE